LARIFTDQGKLVEAEALLRQVLEVERRVLKDDHPGTTNTMNDLATVYLRQKRYDEVEVLHREAFDRRMRVLGEDNVDTLQSMSNLANVQRIRGHYAEAERLVRRAFEKRVKVLGPKHPHTLNSMTGLARTYEDWGRFADAEPLLRELCETDRFSVFAPKYQAQLKARWGHCLVRTNQVPRAEPLLQEAHRLLLETGQPDGPEMRLALVALVDLCARTNRPGEAAKWRAHLAKLPPVTNPANRPATVPG
jgi:tetratricopeptide (TPR) repeat protein